MCYIIYNKRKVCMLIGRKIKALRKEHGMTLSELSERTGVQIATLSRIEHEKMPGTLASHLAISRALGINLADLYRDLSNTPGPDKEAELTTVTEEILVGDLTAKKIRPSLLKMGPGTATDLRPTGQSSEGCVFILDGCVDITIDGRTTRLTTNGFLYITISAPCQITNNGTSIARALIMMTPSGKE